MNRRQITFRMLLAACCGLAAALAPTAVAPAAGARTLPVTTLTATVSPTPNTTVDYVFSCARGERTAACRAVALVSRFARRRPRTCLEIYGGPATATIQGLVHGHLVTLSLSRTNSCEIDRWDRLAALLGSTEPELASASSDSGRVCVEGSVCAGPPPVLPSPTS